MLMAVNESNDKIACPRAVYHIAGFHANSFSIPEMI